MTMILAGQRDGIIAQRLQAELAEVESRFAAELMSDLPCVNSLVTHIERYRGKMLRPMLVLVSGMATSLGEQELSDAHRVVAAVVEMVHMATLVHDDVLDEAEVRRRGATINHLRGNETAVMLGDYLISHAYHLCSSLESTAVSRMIADATNVVCEGELLQLANRDNWELDESTYFEIIRRKTASLCGTCCRLGALLHEAPLRGSRHADVLYDYGEKVGMAFQIIDDLLDLTGAEATVGKTLGRDLAKGKLTLPLIHHLRSAGGADSIRHFSDEPDDRPASETTVAAHGNGKRSVAAIDEASIRYANEWARRLIEDAKENLLRRDGLPETAARQVLLDMADAVLTRKF